MSTEIHSTLNDLIETLKDGQEGFQKAAENVEDPSVKTMLAAAAAQRGQLSAQLQRLVADLGEAPEKSSSFTSALHRGWIDLKSALQGGDAHAILAECERGEDSAMAHFKKALEAGLPKPIDAMVREQYAIVKATHDKVRDLRDALAAA